VAAAKQRLADWLAGELARLAAALREARDEAVRQRQEARRAFLKTYEVGRLVYVDAQLNNV
jgi:Tfp pilus assembly protein FimT